MHIWTKEQTDYLKEIAPGKHRKEITEMLNKKFNINLSLNQVIAKMKNDKIRCGMDTRFKKGDIPYTKGKRQEDYISREMIEKSKKTRFKKGEKPLNWKPVGSERINIYGYVEIKVAEPNKWKYKHRFLYEKEYGEIPDDEMVIFLDNDKENFDISNLKAVTKEESIKLTSRNFRSSNPELTKLGIQILELEKAITRRQK